MLLSIGVVRAHDPYEISVVAYVRSNVIELFLEMEFPAGMTLSGLTPTRDVAAETQFEAGLPRLKDFAGGLFRITAGNHVVQPLRTNVELGVELHIRGRVEFALTDYRPLRFDPLGLKAVTDVPYGISLTVLDMVNQKVLGQSALFADSPPAEFPATNLPAPLAGPTLAVARSNKPVVTSETNPPLVSGVVEARHPSRLPIAVILVGAVVAVLVAWQRSNSRA